MFLWCIYFIECEWKKKEKKKKNKIQKTKKGEEFTLGLQFGVWELKWKFYDSYIRMEEMGMNIIWNELYSQIALKVKLALTIPALI